MNSKENSVRFAVSQPHSFYALFCIEGVGVVHWFARADGCGGAKVVCTRAADAASPPAAAPPPAAELSVLGQSRTTGDKLARP